MNKNFMNLLLIGILVSSIISSCQKEIVPPQYETFTDNRDGETYKYGQIGNQFWLSENLRFKPDSDNYWAYNNNEADVILYGYLYSWEAAIKVCPSGWHLPSNDEWTELSDYLGGSGAAGGKMKVTGTTSWNAPNTDATNSSGFSALSCGTYDGMVFDGRGNLTHFWSSDMHFNIWWLSGHFGHLGSSMVDMYHESASVRCVKD